MHHLAIMCKTLSTRALRPYHYPYSFTQKLAQFPYKFYFTNGRIYRLLAVGCFIQMMVMYEGQKFLLFHPGLKQYWAKRRSHYQHTFFDPPKPPKLKER